MGKNFNSSRSASVAPLFPSSSLSFSSASSSASVRFPSVAREPYPISNRKRKRESSSRHYASYRYRARFAATRRRIIKDEGEGKRKIWRRKREEEAAEGKDDEKREGKTGDDFDDAVFSVSVAA